MIQDAAELERILESVILYEDKVPTEEENYGPYIQPSEPRKNAEVMGETYELPEDQNFTALVNTCIYDLCTEEKQRIPAILNHLLNRHQAQVMKSYHPYHAADAPLLSFTGVTDWNIAAPAVRKIRGMEVVFQPCAPNTPLTMGTSLSRGWKVQ